MKKYWPKDEDYVFRMWILYPVIIGILFVYLIAIITN